MNKKFPEIVPLFSAPLFRDKIAIESYDFENIDWALNQFNLHSTNHKILDLVEFKNLKQQIEERTRYYFYNVIGADIKFQINITDSWLNRSTNSNRHQRHYHRDSIISGVLFLSADENSGGKLVLHSDRKYWIDFDVSKEKESIWNMTEWLESPEIGQMLIFPSWVDHEVEEYNSQNPRISLAWNTWIQS
jgi:uncharacterized protein (TIGR02466 family)